MRINSHAAEQYRRTDALAEKASAKRRTEPQASVKTTTFGFRLGKFGVDYESQRTVLDPSLSRSVREEKQKARAFEAESEVESLRAKVGSEGASYRDTATGSASSANPPLSRVKSALAAYAKSTEDILPPPGNMLAGVV